MITRPEIDKKREGVRALLEAAAQFSPLSAALARLYELTHPSAATLERDRWIDEVTTALNELISTSPQGVIGGFKINPYACWGEGILGLTDEGIGRYAVSFSAPLQDANYHVSISVETGTARILDKRAGGFRIAIDSSTGPVDSDFSFHVPLVGN